MEAKLSVTNLMFDRDGNLWVGTDGNGLFRIHGNTVEHYGHTEACPAIPCGIFLKTEKESSGLEPQAESTAFVIRGSPRSRPWKAWGRIQQRAFWPAEMARSGLPMPARSTTLRTGPSHPFAGAMVFRVIKSPSMLEDQRREHVGGSR